MTRFFAAKNPIHSAAQAIAALCAESWDQGNEFFPPTTFQISNINSGTGADNVIPGELEAIFNFRFSTESTPDQLKQRVVELLDKHRLDYELNWRLSGMPFLTSKGKLLDAITASISDVCGYVPEISTAGGTSDGRFIAPTGSEVVEVGPVNATIHKVDECVNVESLVPLTDIYEAILTRVLKK